MREHAGRKVVVVAILISAIAACSSPSKSSSGPVADGSALTLVECPNFELDTATILVEPHPKAPFRFSGTTEIEFSDSAVSSPALYHVSRGKTGEKALIRIEPRQGAPDTFNAPVRLRLDYSKCPFAKNPGRTLTIVQVDPTPPQRVGGAANRKKEYIETLIDHLTGYSIAN